MIARIFFTLLFIIIGPRVWAQTAPPVPPVFPAQLGSAGSPFKAGMGGSGGYLVWNYTRSGVTKAYTVCWLHDYSVIHPPTIGLTPIQTARAYWVANVTRNCETDPELRDLWESAMLHNSLP